MQFNSVVHGYIKFTTSGNYAINRNIMCILCLVETGREAMLPLYTLQKK